MKNIEPLKLRDVCYAKIKTCNNDEMIIKISEITMVVSQGNICILSLKSMPSPVRLRNKLSEIESLLNMTQHLVIPCTEDTCTGSENT
ncbi:hypothetical protein ABK730_16995 [Klebsiella indica]